MFKKRNETEDLMISVKIQYSLYIKEISPIQNTNQPSDLQSASYLHICSCYFRYKRMHIRETSRHSRAIVFSSEIR